MESQPNSSDINLLRYTSARGPSAFKPVPFRQISVGGVQLEKILAGTGVRMPFQNLCVFKVNTGEFEQGNMPKPILILIFGLWYAIFCFEYPMTEFLWIFCRFGKYWLESWWDSPAKVDWPIEAVKLNFAEINSEFTTNCTSGFGSEVSWYRRSLQDTFWANRVER